MDVMVREIKDTPPRGGFDGVYLPGEPEFLEMRVRQRDGIPAHKSTLADLRRWARELNVEPIKANA